MFTAVALTCSLFTGECEETLSKVTYETEEACKADLTIAAWQWFQFMGLSEDKVPVRFDCKPVEVDA